MDFIWKAAVQGIVQGIAEFLPVSSTAHLLLFGELLDMGHSEFVKIFDIVLHLASILAVVVYFRKILIPVEMLRDKTVRQQTFSLWLKMIVGVIPILIIGAVASKLGWVDVLHTHPQIMAVALFVGGVLLLRIERWCHHEKPVEELSSLSYKTAFLIGLIQCLAIIPGTSRSAAASAYSLLKHHGSMTSEQWCTLGVGSAVTFLVSLFAVSWLMKFIQTHTFELFGWYRMALALTVAAFVYLN